MKSQQPADVKQQLSHTRHELRTPVNAVIGYSEMLIEDVADTGGTSMLPRLNEIRASGKNIQSLINELLGEEQTGSLGADEIPQLAERARDEMKPDCQKVLDHCTFLLQMAESPHYEPLRDDLNRISVAATNFLRLLDGFVTGQPAEQRGSPDGGIEIAEAVSTPDEESKGHILIVDDNAFNRDMLAKLLKREGHSFELAADGRQALSMMEAKPFDAVLLDIMMPEVDGFEALRRMKANAELQHIPVIMISALDEIENVVRCIEMGAEDYLPKPFDPVLLRARLGACLEKKHLRDQELDYLRNVAKVTEAAAKLERGEFQPDSLEEVRQRTDALGGLARMFLSMAKEVEAREQRLKTQVQKLKIEIDESRKSQQVAEITETDYFQSLQQKAQELRRRARK